MASIAELEDALKNAAAAGDDVAATRLADEIVRMTGELEPATAETAPVESIGVPTTEEILSLDPNVTTRGSLLPLGLDQEGSTVFTPSQIMIDVMEALLLPGRVMQGHKPTDKELLNFSGTFAGGAPKNAIQALRTVGADDAAKTAVRGVGEAARPSLPPTADEAATAARSARFDAQEIPATRGDLDQNFNQQAAEQRLLSTTDDASEPLRQLKLQQSDAFIGKVNELVDGLGVPKNVGDSVKEAFSGRINLLRKEKNRLYKEVAESAPEILNAPILTDDIILALPDAKTVRRLRILAPNSVKAVDELMVEFGLDAGEEAVEAFVKSGGEITPLTLGNFDDFRIALGQIDKSDQTGAVKVITGKIREALDQEAALIDNAITGSGITDQSVVKTLSEARSRVREIKTEFSPQAISGRLTGTRRDGVTPVIEASKVSDTLLTPNAPIENLQRVLSNLRASGQKGKVAIGDLQSTVVLDALNAGLKAPSRKTSGIETIGGNQFAKALEKFGDDKLDELFKNNKSALSDLRALKQTAKDITPASAATPRGSAPIILDLMRRFGRMPGIAAVVDSVVFVAKAGADDRAVQRAMKANPTIRRELVTIQSKYPALAQNLGIAQLINQLDQSDVRDPNTL